MAPIDGPLEPGWVMTVEPGIYIPDSVTEWTNEFAWTGAAEREGHTSGQALKKVGALKFRTLRTSPAKSSARRRRGAAWGGTSTCRRCARRTTR